MKRLFVIVLILYVSSCASTQELQRKLLSAAPPKYEGVITPITVPIKLAYKPASLNYTITGTVYVQQEKAVANSIITGKYKVESLGDKLIWHHRILKIFIDNNKVVDLGEPIIEIKALSTKQGQIEQIDIDVPALKDAEMKKDMDEEFNAIARKNVESSTLSLPINPVRTGDTIHIDSSDSISDLAYFQGYKVRMDKDLNWVLEGFSQYNSRKTIVATINESLEKKYTDEIKFKAKIIGYKLFDADTLHLLKSEMMLDVTGPDSFAKGFVSYSANLSKPKAFSTLPSKPIVDKSRLGKSDRRAILLPIVETCDDPDSWPRNTKVLFQNAVGEAAYNEIKRYLPFTMHLNSLGFKKEKHWETNCFNTTECINYLKKEYGEIIFIYGEAWMQRLGFDASSLTMWVLDAKTGSKKKFFFSERYKGPDIGGSGAKVKFDLESFNMLTQNLIKGIFYDKQLIKYLLEDVELVKAKVSTASLHQTPTIDEKKPVTLKPKLAILPWMFDGSKLADQQTPVALDGLRMALLQTDIFEPVYSFYGFGNISTPKPIEKIAVQADSAKSYWVGLLLKPNVDLLCNIGKRMGVDAVLTSRIKVWQTDPKQVGYEVLLVDVNTGKINSKSFLINQGDIDTKDYYETNCTAFKQYESDRSRR